METNDFDFTTPSPSFGLSEIRVKPFIPSATEFNILPNNNIQYPRIAPSVDNMMDMTPSVQSSNISTSSSENISKENKDEQNLDKAEANESVNSSVNYISTPKTQDFTNIAPKKYSSKVPDSKYFSVPDVTQINKPKPSEESHIIKDNNSNKNTFIDNNTVFLDDNKIEFSPVNPVLDSNVLVIFIPGTLSSKDRWISHPKIIDGYNDIFSKYGLGESENMNNITNYFFDWKTDKEKGIDNGLFNDYNDRKAASKKLNSEIRKMLETGKYNKLILVGQSHGGNVAIQSAEELSKLVDDVTLFTIATPANNENNICHNPNSLMISFANGLGNNPSISFDDPYRYTIYQRIKENHFKIGNLERNPESGRNFEGNPKIKHFALYSKDDHVDDFSHILESTKEYSGMNNHTACFDNRATKNIELPRNEVGYLAESCKAVKECVTDEVFDLVLTPLISDIVRNPNKDYKARINSALLDIISNMGISIENSAKLSKAIYGLVIRLLLGPHSIDLENPEIIFDAIRKTDPSKNNIDSKGDEKDDL